MSELSPRRRHRFDPPHFRRNSGRTTHCDARTTARSAVPPPTFATVCRELGGRALSSDTSADRPLRPRPDHRPGHQGGPCEAERAPRAAPPARGGVTMCLESVEQYGVTITHAGGEGRLSRPGRGIYGRKHKPRLGRRGLSRTDGCCRN